MTTNHRELFNQLHQDISAQLTGRERAAKLVVASLLTRSHGFFYGPPGTGKSALLLLVGQAFKDAGYYQTLMHGQSKASDLFGSADLAAFKRNEMRTNTKRKLPEADIAFLDEIWKCNAQTLNALLQLINERRYNNGDHVQICPLVSLFGASNELPDDSSLEAIRDRFVWSYFVEPVKDKTSFDAIVTSGPMEVEPTLTLEQLREAQKAVDAVRISKDFLDSLYEVKIKLNEHFGPQLFISDRRWKMIAQFAKGLAYMDGYDEVPRSIIPQLAPCLWKEANQISIIREILHQFGDDIRRVVTPHVTTIRGLFEVQNEILSTILQKSDIYDLDADVCKINYAFFKALREGSGKIDLLGVKRAASGLVAAIERHESAPEDSAKILDYLNKARTLEASISGLISAVTVTAGGIKAHIEKVEHCLDNF